jgi:hypothetical protein
VPSEPETLTEAAFDAVMVSVSELPGLMELFCAEIDTMGPVVPAPTVTVVWAVALPLPFVAVAV